MTSSWKAFVPAAIACFLCASGAAAAPDHIRLSSGPPVVLEASDFIGLDRAEVWGVDSGSDTYLYTILVGRLPVGPDIDKDLSIGISEAGSYRVNIFDAAGNKTSVRVVIDTQAPVSVVERLAWTPHCGRQVPLKVEGSAQDDLSGVKTLRWSIHDRSADLHWERSAWIPGRALPQHVPIERASGRWVLDVSPVRWPARAADMSLWVSATDAAGNGAVPKAVWGFSVAAPVCGAPQ